MQLSTDLTLAVGLALVIPTGQSLIADYHVPTERGTAFGVLYLTSSAGGMAAAYFATLMSACSCSELPEPCPARSSLS